jgi:hypothetical protein
VTFVFGGGGPRVRLEAPQLGLVRFHDYGDLRDKVSDGVNNPEAWPDDWVFTDSRFGMQHGDDELVLQFLAEMLHPVVRPDEEEVVRLLNSFNEALAKDGCELYPAD